MSLSTGQPANYCIRAAITTVVNRELGRFDLKLGPYTGALNDASQEALSMSRILRTNTMVAGSQISFPLCHELIVKQTGALNRLLQLVAVHAAHQELTLPINELAQSNDRKVARLAAGAIVTQVIKLLQHLGTSRWRCMWVARTLRKTLAPFMPS